MAGRVTEYDIDLQTLDDGGVFLGTGELWQKASDRQEARLSVTDKNGNTAEVRLTRNNLYAVIKCALDLLHLNDKG